MYLLLPRTHSVGAINTKSPDAALTGPWQQGFPGKQEGCKQRQLGTVGHADGDRRWKWGEMHPGKRGSWEKGGMARITWMHACFQKNSHCYSYSPRHLFTQMFITYTCMHREHPHKGKNGYTVVQFPYRVTHGSRTMQKKNTSTGMAPRLPLPTSDSSLCVCLSLFLSLSLSLFPSFSSLPSLSTYFLSPLPAPHSFFAPAQYGGKMGGPFGKQCLFAPSGWPAREDGCRLRLINM